MSSTVKYILVIILSIIMSAVFLTGQIFLKLSQAASAIEGNIDISVSGDNQADTSLESNVDMSDSNDVIVDNSSDIEDSIEDSDIDSDDVNDDGVILISTKKQKSKVKFDSYDRDEVFNYLHGKPYTTGEEYRNGISSREPDIKLDQCLSYLAKAHVENGMLDRQSAEEIFNALTYWLKHERTECRVSLNGEEIEFDSDINKKFKESMHVRELVAKANESNTGYERIDIHLYDVELGADNKPTAEYVDIMENKNEIIEFSELSEEEKRVKGILPKEESPIETESENQELE